MTGTTPQHPHPRRASRFAAAALAVVVGAGLVASAPAAPGVADRAPDVSRLRPVRGPAATHDPSMVRGRDGAFYIFSTHNGIEIRRSRDLVHWRFVGEVLPGGASWAGDYQEDGAKDAWAPDASYHRGRYWLYYAISSFGSNHSAIGLATSPSARPGTWTDHGKVLGSVETDDYNAIDPTLTVDRRGRWWLAFGSFWGGLRMVRLDPDTGKPASSQPRVHPLAQRDDPDALEGPALKAHGSWYYLFASYGLCCRGIDSTYSIRVGRSRSITGPYVDRQGRPLLEGGGSRVMSTNRPVVGPGGESLARVGGRDLLVHHYYNEKDAGTPRLGIAVLRWRHGWPYVVPHRGDVS